MSMRLLDHHVGQCKELVMCGESGGGGGTCGRVVHDCHCMLATVWLMFVTDEEWSHRCLEESA